MESGKSLGGAWESLGGAWVEPGRSLGGLGGVLEVWEKPGRAWEEPGRAGESKSKAFCVAPYGRESNS